MIVDLNSQQSAELGRKHWDRRVWSVILLIAVHTVMTLQACSDEHDVNLEKAHSNLPRSKKETSRTDTSMTVEANQYDASGKKHGFWINKLSSIRQHCYYWHGVLDGAFLAYENKPDRLLAVGWYKDGKEYGTWLEFRSNGTLYQTDDYSFKDSLLYNKGLDTGDRDTCKVIYKTVFYPNGARHSEGFVLETMDSDNELFFWLKGKWKFYKEDGSLAKDEIYSPTTNGSMIPDWP